MEIEELAQKLYEDDGGQNDLYKATDDKIRKYERQAAEIIENHTGYTTDF